MKIQYEIKPNEFSNLLWHLLTRTKPIKYFMYFSFFLLSAILAGGIAYVLVIMFGMPWLVAVNVSIVAVTVENFIVLFFGRKMTDFLYKPFFAGTKFAGARELNVTEEELRQDGSDSTTNYQWKAISSVQQTSKFVFVFSRHEPIIYIPRQTFKSQDEERTFLETVVRLSGKKVGAVSAEHVGPLKRMLVILSLTTVLATVLFAAGYLVSRDVAIDGIDIVGYGIFDANLLGKREAKDTSLGSVQVAYRSNLIKETDRIPGVLGTVFGLKYKVKSDKKWGSTHLQIKVVHPETINPNNQTASTVDTWQRIAPVNTETADSWIFEYDWEIVPGTWTIQIWHKNKILAEKSFLILKE